MVRIGTPETCWYCVWLDNMEPSTDGSRGDTAGALNLILTDPPYGEGVEEAKVRLELYCERGIHCMLPTGRSDNDSRREAGLTTPRL
jgi:hypothetical protein